VTLMRHEREQVKRIAAGDHAALKMLHDAYYPRLARFLLRLTRDPAMVAPIVNDVWLSVWQHAGEFRGDVPAFSWILSIAYRQALREMAKVRRDAGPPAAAATRMADRGHDQKLERALGALAAEQRAVVELGYVFGYSCGEIAVIVGCSEQAVRSRMLQGRRALRMTLQEASGG
jgi:RNA polymerase sigma factor (sigma-70 family)